MTLKTPMFASSSHVACPRGIAPTAAAVLVALATAACGRVGFDTVQSGRDTPDAGIDATSDPVGTGQPDAGPAGIALIQQTTGSKPSATSASATLPRPTVPGDLLVVVGGDDGGLMSGVTGGGVASWSRATASDKHANIEIWYGVVTTASSSAVTLASDATGNARLNVTEWSGLVPRQADVLDAAAAQPGTADKATAPSITTTHAGDLIVFAVSDYDPNSFEVPKDGSWSTMTSVDLVGHYTESSWFQIVSAAGAVQPRVDQTANNWEAGIAAFKIAP